MSYKTARRLAWVIIALAAVAALLGGITVGTGSVNHGWAAFGLSIVDALLGVVILIYDRPDGATTSRKDN